MSASPVEGVSCGTQPRGDGAEEGVDTGEEFLVSPFGLLFPVDFAVVGLADVVPQLGDEAVLLVGSEPAESISHDIEGKAGRSLSG